MQNMKNMQNVQNMRNVQNTQNTQSLQNMQQTILLVEDNKSINQINRQAFEMEGYAVVVAQTLSEAKSALAAGPVDLIVLDIMMPDGNGLDFCRELREDSTIPVLFLTALGDKSKLLEGLRAGGDDYLSKPFMLEELLARAAALLRRAGQYMTRTAGNTVIGPLRVDTASMKAYINDVDTLLTGKEYALMLVLMENRDRYISAEELYRTVWGFESVGDSAATIRVHINGLRKKLGSTDTNGIEIETGYKQGYRLWRRK